MIKKIKVIENLAVFRKFEWDKSVLDKEGNIVEFKEINVVYGRNYSGKTTLSRILRAAETGKISDKYENPSFSILFKDNSEIKQNALTGHGKQIRVFNDDFVRENLKFIINPNDNIESFAILGDTNNDIQEEINKIEIELGSSKEGLETALYAAQKKENDDYNTAKSNHQSRKTQLDAKLTVKATDRQIGIKYKADKFGDQNYSKPKLEKDIETVLMDTFQPIDSSKQTELEKLLGEKVNDSITPLSKFSSKLSSLKSEAERLITQKIGESDKIDELIKDAVLNKWVKEGRLLHKDKRTKCAFCDSDILENRWGQLEKHFDEESEKLEKDIDILLLNIESEITTIKNVFKINKNNFYSKYHNVIDRLIIIYNSFSGKQIEEINKIKEQLISRKNDLLNPKVFVEIQNYSKRINWLFNIYENIRILANNYSGSLVTDQTAAKELLRLKEVFDFVSTINYSNEITAISNLKANEEESKIKLDKVSNEITEKKQLIISKKGEQKDETKGAEKVNEYLNNFFGHGFLSLRAIEIENGNENEAKKYRFEVIRDRKKAFHLSEGECSLIAFCYFMAKLNEIETKGLKPIIWIDDPISSLDGNHIFFIYGLLNAEIVSKNIFEQLFISTHNLDFLKYLRRLTGHFHKADGKNQEYSKSYFVIQRNDKDSEICLMPKFLKDYVTEFNYLFQQIYNCSKITVINDSNYTTFYNFGNNARKFLEVYLYYKYPDSSDESKKLQKFFDGDKIPSILTERINNEYSHLSAVFERGATPVEVPEMKTTAEKIIERIKSLDKEQYNSLLLSIGETP